MSQDQKNQMKGRIETIKDFFGEASRKVPRRSGEVAKDVLDFFVDQTKKTTPVFIDKARYLAQQAAERLKQAGTVVAKASAGADGKAARVVAEKAKELGTKSVEVAKGAASGMWIGAKDALKKGSADE